MSQPALSGIRVVDLSQLIAGPSAASLLAELGADVIKIESFDGDTSRNMGEARQDGCSAIFAAYNKGKRSIALNLRHKDGLAVAITLIKDADILVEAFRTGVMDRLGLGYEAMREINPGLVYVSFSGFGHDGPMATRPGVDLIVQAESGIMSVTGELGGEPLKIGFTAVDAAGGFAIGQAALAGLVRRMTQNVGSHIRLNLLDVALYMQAAPMTEFLMTSQEPRRSGNFAPLGSPAELFHTADSTMIVSAYFANQWPDLCRLLSVPELLDDPRFSSNSLRIQNRGALHAILEARFRTATSQEWKERLGSTRITFGDVLGYSQVVQHEQVLANGSVVPVRLGEGELRSVRSPIRVDGVPAEDLSIPRLGGDGAEILSEIGFSADQVQQLRQDGAML